MYWFGVPSSSALMKSPAAGMKVSSVPATTPGIDSGSVTRRKTSRRRAVEVVARLEQAVVDPLERGVERQDHERQEVVGDAGDHGTVVSSRRPSSDTMPTVFRRVTTKPGVGQDRLPRERPDQVGHEERRDHGQEQRVAPPPATEGDDVGERIADQEGGHRGHPAYSNERRNCSVVVGDRVGVVRELPVEDVAGLERARLERLERHVAERDERRRPPANRGPEGGAGREARPSGDARTRLDDWFRGRVLRGRARPSWAARTKLIVEELSARTRGAIQRRYGASSARAGVWNQPLLSADHLLERLVQLDLLLGLSCRKMNAFDSVSSSGKISWLLASAGSRLARISWTPSTGQM